MVQYDPAVSVTCKQGIELFHRIRIAVHVECKKTAIFRSQTIEEADRRRICRSFAPEPFSGVRPFIIDKDFANALDAARLEIFLHGCIKLLDTGIFVIQHRCHAFVLVDDIQFRLSGEGDIGYVDAARHMARRLGAGAELVEPTTSRNAGLKFRPFRYTSLDTSRVTSQFGIDPPNAFDVIDDVFGLPIP